VTALPKGEPSNAIGAGKRLLLEAREACAAVVSDIPVAYQSRSETGSAEDGGEV